MPDVATLAAALAPFVAAGDARAANIRRLAGSGSSAASVGPGTVGAPTKNRIPHATTIADAPLTVHAPSAEVVELPSPSTTFVTRPRTRTSLLFGMIGGVILSVAAIAVLLKWRSDHGLSRTASAQPPPPDVRTPAPPRPPASSPAPSPPAPATPEPSVSAAPTTSAPAATSASPVPSKPPAAAKPARPPRPAEDDKILDIRH
jgi:hypothetical protein